jgi:hypothetical protein
VPGIDQPLDGVGDLQLPPRRRDEPRRDLVDILVEELDSDDGEIRDRFGRLLDQPLHVPILIEDRHTERGGILHRAQQYLRRGGVLPKMGGIRDDAPLAEVVAEEPADSLVS